MKSKTRLFVGSLPYRYTESELLKLFITYGKVIDVRIIKNPWGRSRGMGYVELENEADAILAKEGLHASKVGDLNIIVDFAKDDPALTEEGIKKHLESKNKKKRSYNRPFGSLDGHVRETVFTQRKFGSKVGAKFAKRNKKK